MQTLPSTRDCWTRLLYLVLKYKNRFQDVFGCLKYVIAGPSTAIVDDYSNLRTRTFIFFNKFNALFFRVETA